MDIDRSKPVLLTGATGYVAGQICRRLLEEGLTVHATVRDPSKTERLAYLRELADANPGSITFFKADLTDEGSFAEAMAGCGVVFHTASPFMLGTDDPQKNLVEPAVNGTRNVLETANQTPSVTRVVVTSSCVAIYGDCTDIANTAEGTFTEEHWNETSSLEYGAYGYSKTLAEREAWKIHDAQSRWRLVTINPSMVMGPGVRIHPSSESHHMVKQIGDGTLARGVPAFGMGVVDVRDVAEAHLRAGFLPDAQGRHLVSGTNTNLAEMAFTLQKRFGDTFPIPTRKAPKWLLYLLSPFIGLSWRSIRGNVDVPWVGDNSKSKRELGLTYRSLDETMNDFFQQLVDAGELG